MSSGVSSENDTTLADIDKRLEELQTELVKLANSKAEYDKTGDEIYRLRDEKQKVQLDIIGRDELKKSIEDMGDFILRECLNFRVIGNNNHKGVVINERKKERVS